MNVTTPGRLSVDEVRDLLNRHLLSRGYTLLALDGGYTIVKCDAIKPALVPRIEESELQRSVIIRSFALLGSGLAVSRKVGD